MKNFEKSLRDKEERGSWVCLRCPPIRDTKEARKKWQDFAQDKFARLVQIDRSLGGNDFLLKMRNLERFFLDAVMDSEHAILLVGESVGGLLAKKLAREMLKQRKKIVGVITLGTAHQNISWSELSALPMSKRMEMWLGLRILKKLHQIPDTIDSPLISVGGEDDRRVPAHRAHPTKNSPKNWQINQPNSCHADLVGQPDRIFQQIGLLN
ncbi:MAG: hypothetical protein ABIE14_00485 [Patescibacteria group bacterium]